MIGIKSVCMKDGFYIQFTISNISHKTINYELYDQMIEYDNAVIAHRIIIVLITFCLHYPPNIAVVYVLCIKIMKIFYCNLKRMCRI